MSDSITQSSTPRPANADDDETTGLPTVATWRGVYLWVTGIFVFWVALLTALSRVFS